MAKSFAPRFFAILIAPAVALAAGALAGAPAAPPAAAPVVLVVGDSLSAGYSMRAEQGWVALLSVRLAAEGRPHRVVNASITGDTTASGAARLPRALLLHRPAVVVIELGGNDGLRGIPLATTRQNLVAMVRTAQRAGAQVLLIGVRLPPNYGSDWGGRFHALYSEVARAERVALLPVLVDEAIATDPKLMQSDGLHPSVAAQPLLLAKVWPALQPLLQNSAALPAAAAR